MALAKRAGAVVSCGTALADELTTLIRLNVHRLLGDLIALSARRRLPEIRVARVADRPGLGDHPQRAPRPRTPDARHTRHALAAFGIICAHE